ncbi:MAG: hypothetical protein ACE5JB_01295 [bacterium]
MGKALLIIVIGFSIIFSGVMFNVTSNHQRSAKEIIKHYEKWIAHNSIESASNVAISKLYQNFNWNSGYTNLAFYGADYSVTVTDITGDSATEAKKVQITSVATYNNASDTTIAVFMQPAYSYYYYFVNNWPLSLKYNTGDTLLGPIHANSKIKIKGDPVFIARVSSNQGTYLPAEASPDPKFYGGAEFGTQIIPMPDLTPITNAGLSGGDVYTDKLWLTFFTDGTYQCSTSVVNTIKSISSHNGIIMTTSNQYIHVKGVVNGQVTVLSDRDIFIDDDIVYADDPRVNSNSDDYLGLIAAHRVNVVDNVANSSNVEIHAAILAHHDELNVENYNIGSPRGTLTILGSIIQNDALPYGTYHEGTLETGYEGNHICDIRLIDKTPPYFPRLNRVEKVYRSD